jgi:ribonuclease P/MRP protein subunit RPP40
MSGRANVRSPVTQGSCLGPLLFLIYINDVTNIFGVDVVCKLYADDAKLYSTIETDTDFSKLQTNLDKLAAWSFRMQLTISVTKCAILSIGTNVPQCPYYIDQSNIERVSAVKDLGITVDESLKFAIHIDNIVAKARIRASLILKCFTSRNA